MDLFELHTNIRQYVMFRLVVLVISLFTFVASVSAAESTSSTLGTYNLILLEDYNFQGGDVQGQVLIGGDLNANGRAVEFGSRLANTDTAIDAVTIMGDVNANQIRVLNDNNLVYGGALNVSHVELNDGNDGAAIYNANLSIDEVAASLHADSAYFASLSANGTYSDGIFNYVGTDSVAVFNVSAGDIFAQNSNLSLNWGDAETVIINVSAGDAVANDIVVGGGVNLNNGFNGSEAFSNVLWNFYDAESIDFNSLAVKGSVLAPLATTRGGASFDGSFAAVSYTGAREFHNYVFNYETPSAPPVVTVPEPPTIAVLALFLLFLSFRRVRRY
jgi:choice-of-anchor A domain-containing protein